MLLMLERRELPPGARTMTLGDPPKPVDSTVEHRHRKPRVAGSFPAALIQDFHSIVRICPCRLAGPGFENLTLETPVRFRSGTQTSDVRKRNPDEPGGDGLLRRFADVIVSPKRFLFRLRRSSSGLDLRFSPGR